MRCLSLLSWRVEQVAWVNAQSGGDAKNVSQGYVAFPALYAAHVSAVYSGIGGESFLAQSSSLSQSSYALTETLQWVLFH
jgi:hypothetical protein